MTNNNTAERIAENTANLEKFAYAASIAERMGNKTESKFYVLLEAQFCIALKGLGMDTLEINSIRGRAVQAAMNAQRDAAGQLSYNLF